MAVLLNSKKFFSPNLRPAESKAQPASVQIKH